MHIVAHLLGYLERGFAAFDRGIDAYRQWKFRRCARKQRDRGVEFLDLRIGVRSQRPKPLVHLAAFQMGQKERRYYVEASVGDTNAYRQEVGPIFYSYPNRPPASRGDRRREEDGAQAARDLCDTFEEILVEMGFEVERVSEESPRGQAAGVADD